MKVGKAKMGFKARKDVEGDSGTFHRGHGGSRSRKVRRCKRAIEKTVRQAARRQCQES